MGLIIKVVIFLAVCALAISLETTKKCSDPVTWEILTRDAFQDDDQSKVGTQNLRIMLMGVFRDSSIICLIGKQHLVEICNNPKYLSRAPEAWIFSKEYPQNPRNISSIVLASYENYYRFGSYMQTIFHYLTDTFMRRRNSYFIEGTLKILTVMRRILRKSMPERDFETAMKRVDSIEIPEYINCRNLSKMEEEKLFAAAVHDAVTNANQLIVALRDYSNTM